MKRFRFVLLGLVILLCVTVTACSGKTVPDESISEGLTSEYEGNDTEITNSLNNETSTDKSEDNNDNSSIEEDEKNDNSMRIEIIFENEKFKVNNSDKVYSLYNKLSNLKYEVTEDKPLNDAISIYFYDENDNMITMFAIYENYLKLNGLPDTYKITSDDFNYNTFVEEMETMK